MRTYTCKCGDMISWTSGMMPAVCRKCQKCGTTYGGGEVQPHNYSTTYVDTDEGRKPLTYCTMCSRHKYDIEKVQS